MPYKNKDDLRAAQMRWYRKEASTTDGLARIRARREKARKSMLPKRKRDAVNHALLIQMRLAEREVKASRALLYLIHKEAK